MLEQRTVLERIEIEVGSGRIFMKLQKQIVDGDNVIATEPHRSVVEAGGDVDAQMALVNAHLVQMGKEPTEPDHVDLLKEMVANFRSTDIGAAAEKKAADKKKADEAAALAAEPK